jgi:branched-chain amino acid aminotransferase
MSSAVPSISVTRTAAPRADAIKGTSEIAFSSVFSDHMFTATWRQNRWADAGIRPYGPLSLSPNISALQYGLSVFEGLKVQRMPDGRVALFRPASNARRLNISARRLAMPEVPEALFLEALRTLVRLDQAWVPQHGTGALYVRPCLFATDPSVRVRPPEECLFVIFTFPFSSYYSGTVDLLVSESHVRAFPGGTGDIKPAGNYAPTLLAEREARDAGLHSVLWLDGVHRSFIEECGVMNIFFVLDDEVITPPLEGTILPGITRDSALTLLRDMGARVTERRVSIEELVESHRAGRLRECFGTGTAATLSRIGRIRYRNEDLRLPAGRPDAVGSVLRERLNGVASGTQPDRHQWLEVLSPSADERQS